MMLSSQTKQSNMFFVILLGIGLGCIQRITQCLCQICRLVEPKVKSGVFFFCFFPLSSVGVLHASCVLFYASFQALLIHVFLFAYQTNKQQWPQDPEMIYIFSVLYTIPNNLFMCVVFYLTFLISLKSALKCLIFRFSTCDDNSPSAECS